MKYLSILYYLIAVVLLVYIMSGALPFLKNLLPGIKGIQIALPVLLILLTHFSPHEIIRSFRLSGKKQQGEKDEYKNAVHFFHTAQYLFLTVMGIGVIVLIIWFLGSGPNSRHIAHPVNIMVTFLFFPLVFILFLCIPFKSAVKKKMNEL